VEALAIPPNSTRTTSTPHKLETKADVGDDGFPVDLMDVHVGGRKFLISEVDKLQSSVLTSYIMRKPGRTPWIMDPDLQDISPKDFEAVQQFVQSSEFELMYIHQADDSSKASGNGSPEGIETVEQDSEQIRRLGRLYVLAGKLGLEEMQGLVFKKLKAGFLDRWELWVMLQMIEQVWSDVPATVDDAVMIVGTG
jgi:hypothetical protein